MIEPSSLNNEKLRRKNGCGKQACFQQQEKKERDMNEGRTAIDAYDIHVI